MDSHGEIVARRVAEARASGAGARRYFGWSSILDADAFAEWKASHGHELDLSVGRLARLPDHTLAWNLASRYWGGRVPGIVPAPGREVWGMLWDVRAEDWPVLEHKEGVVTGLCVPMTVRIEADDATAFTTNPARAASGGPISSGFLEAWARGARKSGLPETSGAGIVGKAS